VFKALFTREACLAVREQLEEWYRGVSLRLLQETGALCLSQ
jgi:hypothetical protein